MFDEPIVCCLAWCVGVVAQVSKQAQGSCEAEVGQVQGVEDGDVEGWRDLSREQRGLAIVDVEEVCLGVAEELSQRFEGA